MFLLAIFGLLALVHSHDERLKDENGNYIHRACATEEYNEALLAQDPEWQKSLDDFEIKWAEISKAIQSGTYKSESQSIAIPVVFHIVKQNPNSISDSIVAAQMTQLQLDYSAQNSDYTSGTPAEFRAVRSGDFLFRIFNDQRINKVTSTGSFGTNNAIKYDSQGGSDVVNPESKLNFWAGTLSGGLLGYAQFPGGNDATDGVVNGDCTMGSRELPGSCSPYNYGRTATHEIGHWLNLRHIWGDNSGCTNTLLISDFVTDTPPSSSSNFGCPAGTKRCSQNTYSQDMYMNFMDYVEDHCMVMFTELQKERAYASIDQYRGGFSPANVRRSTVEYINWLYFTRFEEEQLNENKCYGDHILFYDNNINENSDSNVYIYGCIQKTDFMSVSHITDIYFIFNEEKCKDGYTRATQDLNEGNDGNIYLCYTKEDSTIDNQNLAILDMTFISNDNMEKIDVNIWEINGDNINPQGSKLNLAMRKDKYFDDELMNVKGDNGSVGEGNNMYISVGVGMLCLVFGVIGFILWRKVCMSKDVKEAMNKSLSEEYGAMTEMTGIQTE